MTDWTFDGTWPYEPQWFDSGDGRMHYIDEGPRDGRPVVLVHGNPTWGYLYRHFIPPLVEAGHRAIVPDHLGFGRSEKPDEPELYRVPRHAARLDALLESLDLRGATVVGQDWGGPLGMRLAVERPDRVARLVLLNTGIVSGRPPSDVWLRFRDVVRSSGTDFEAGRLIRRACTSELPDDVVAAYDAPFPTPESKTGILMFPEQVPTEPDHPSAAKLREVRAKLEAWERPALVFFGDSDPIFPPSVAERIAGLIPGAELQEPVRGAGHFLQEDAGEELGAVIAAFVAET